jgi:hypothetical protein
LVGYQGITFRVSPLITHEKQQLLTPNSDLIAAAEAINWPAIVDYNSQSSEKRMIFETSFLKVLKLQSM